MSSALTAPALGVVIRAGSLTSRRPLSGDEGDCLIALGGSFSYYIFLGRGEWFRPWRPQELLIASDGLWPSGHSLSHTCSSSYFGEKEQLEL